MTDTDSSSSSSPASRPTALTPQQLAAAAAGPRAAVSTAAAPKTVLKIARPTKAAPKTPPAAPPETPSEIGKDTPCLSCDYNLRGLMSDGRCPECGMPIGRSLRGNRLQYADPTYVGKLASGSRLILWGLLIGFVVGILNISQTIKTAMGVSIPLIQLFAGLLWLAGTWLATASEPNKIDVSWQINVRRFLRIFVIFSLGWPVTMLWEHFAITSAVGAGAIPKLVRLTQIFLGLAILFGAMGTAATLCQFVYFARLARRIPDARLAKSTRSIMWALVIFGSFYVAMFLCIAFPSALHITGELGMILAALTLAAVLGLLICFIWWLVLLAAYRKRFAAQAAVAETTWARDLA